MLLIKTTDEFAYIATHMRNLFLAAVLLPLGVLHAQVKKLPYTKLSTDLMQMKNISLSGDSVDISISVKEAGSFPGLKILIQQPSLKIYTARVAVSQLDSLSGNDNIIFINQIHTPKEELTTGATDYTLNGVTYAQHSYPLLTGDSIAASVKERLLDTTDIDLKGRVFKTGLENTFITSHASLMATIITGAGNSSPLARGAAPGALVTSSSFANLLPDSDSVFRKYGISVQNHSYGTVVENFYGNEAAGYDISATNNPVLLHVFSAGNSGTSTTASGNYAGVKELANLSGNFKHAKNILTVSAVDSSGQVMPLSSKGPSYDGRVKPELVAYGEDGSSGAAALVSGAALLVQDAYRHGHNGTLPPSWLVKAALLNSADEAGAKHIDFLSGFGSLDTYKAIQTITNNHLFENSLVQGETKQFTIPVPANSAQLKVTLVWNDPAAPPNAAKALVNDLDLKVVLPSTGGSWLPWVLNAAPTKDSLLLPAQRKTDTLNNVEQVTIDAPAAGTYTIEVKGRRLSTAAQSFAVVYQIDSSNTFYWTYPTTSDHLQAGRVQPLRWQTNLSGPATLEYSVTGGSWQPIGTLTDVAQKFYKWNVPDTVTTARVRMIAASGTIQTDVFTINPLVNLQVGFNCSDSLLLFWNNLHTSGYKLHELGARYLQPLLSTPDTSVVLPLTQHTSTYYSVAPLINGVEGLRSFTIDYTAAGVGCYLRSFYVQGQSGNLASFRAELGTLYNVAEVTLEKLAANGFGAFTSLTNLTTPVFTFSDPALKQGENRYRLRVKLSDGKYLYSETLVVYYSTPAFPVVIYPNPAKQSDVIKIIIDEVGRYTLRITDANGRVLRTQDLNSTVMQINASPFSGGIYFLQVLDAKGRTTTQKLLVY